MLCIARCSYTGRHWELAYPVLKLDLMRSFHPLLHNIRRIHTQIQIHIRLPHRRDRGSIFIASPISKCIFSMRVIHPKHSMMQEFPRHNELGCTAIKTREKRHRSNEILRLGKPKLNEICIDLERNEKNGKKEIGKLYELTVAAKLCVQINTHSRRLVQ